jgi:hypothetical protein
LPRLPAAEVSHEQGVVGSLTFAPVAVIRVDRAVTAESTHAVKSVRCVTGWFACAAVVSRLRLTWALDFAPPDRQDAAVAVIRRATSLVRRRHIYGTAAGLAAAGR